MDECRINSMEQMFVGIDPSLTGTGIIVLDQNSCILEQKLISTNVKDIEEKRLLDIISEIRFVSGIVRLNSVYIEGPSFASQGRAVLQMGALHYLIRIFLYEHSLNYKIISPGTLKKFVTGKGNAKKDLMLLNVFKKWGAEFDDNNLGDAYSLARLALEENLK
jgi:crossover junction endodeoxyribonuclease RuvC